MRRALYRFFTFLARACVDPRDLPHTDAGAILMALIADFPPILDELNALPAKIAADKAAAVQAAEAQHTQDVADTVAAVKAAADAAAAAS